MSSLTREKLAQARALVAASGLDAWITFVRETVEGSDPVLPLILEGGLTWQSALIVTKTGRAIAVVGNYDADMVASSGDWDDVVPYVQSIRLPLVETLEREIPIPEAESHTDPAKLVSALVAPTVESGLAAAVAPPSRPKIGVNFSPDNVKADGLSYGMFLVLSGYFEKTRFEGGLVSAEQVAGALRAQKTESEIAAMRAAIRETDELFEKVGREVRAGMTEREVWDMLQAEIDRRELGYAWDRAQDPIVNSGPDSMVGHGVPSASIQLSPGHIFHIDMGVIKDGYSSDIQRCWYLPHPAETGLPEDVQRAAEAVVGAISAGAAVLKPGVEGWEVDAAARNYLVSKGYPEYLHAFGHQVGRMAHDGGAVLGPRWERYGKTPMTPICANEVYTLELGVFVEGRGYLGLEEMVAVRADGLEWLTTRQTKISLLRN